MEKSYTNLKKGHHKNGVAEFNAEIAESILEENMDDALVRITRNFSLPGFRKGKVPDHLLREHVNERELLETAAEDALHEAIKEIIADEQLSILGRPELTITKIDFNQPVSFKVRFAIAPEITLPDYKAVGKTIADRKDAIEVADKEIEEAIQHILQSMPEKPAEMTDDLATKLGPFKDVAELRGELKRQLLQEKELEAREKKREEIIKEIVRLSKMEVPELLIDQEWRAFSEERNADLSRAGLSLEKYLEQIKKNEKTLEKEERTLIKEQLKTSLVFREIQKQENIKADENEIHANMNYLKARYPERDQASLHQTAEAVILQEKVFDLLGAGRKKE